MRTASLPAIHTHTHTHTHMYIYVYIYTYIYTHVNITHTHTHVYIYTIYVHSIPCICNPDHSIACHGICHRHTVGMQSVACYGICDRQTVHMQRMARPVSPRCLTSWPSAPRGLRTATAAAYMAARGLYIEVMCVHTHTHTHAHYLSVAGFLSVLLYATMLSRKGSISACPEPETVYFIFSKHPTAS